MTDDILLELQISGTSWRKQKLELVRSGMQIMFMFAAGEFTCAVNEVSLIDIVSHSAKCGWPASIRKLAQISKAARNVKQQARPLRIVAISGD